MHLFGLNDMATYIPKPEVRPFEEFVPTKFVDTFVCTNEQSLNQFERKCRNSPKKSKKVVLSKGYVYKRNKAANTRELRHL